MAKNVETGMGKETDPFGFNVATKQAFAQGVEAMDNFFNGLNQTIASAPSGGTEFGEKLKEIATKNVTATHECMKQLSQAKDLQDMFRIQTEFIQAQLSAFGEQAQALGKAFTQSTAGEVKKPPSS